MNLLDSSEIIFFMNVKFGIITFIMLSSLIALSAITYAVNQHYKRHNQSMPGSLVLASTAGFICDLAVSFMVYMLPFQSATKIHNMTGLIATVFNGLYIILADITNGISLILIASSVFIVMYGVDKYSLYKKSQSHRKLSIVLLLALGMFILGCLGDTVLHSSCINTATEYKIEAHYHTNKKFHKHIIELKSNNKSNQKIQYAIIHYNGINNGKFRKGMSYLSTPSFK